MDSPRSQVPYDTKGKRILSTSSAKKWGIGLLLLLLFLLVGWLVWVGILFAWFGLFVEVF